MLPGRRIRGRRDGYVFSLRGQWTTGTLGAAGRLRPVRRLVEVADSYTLIPLDQPARFAQIIREWLGTAR